MEEYLGLISLISHFTVAAFFLKQLDGAISKKSKILVGLVICELAVLGIDGWSVSTVTPHPLMLRILTTAVPAAIAILMFLWQFPIATIFASYQQCQTLIATDPLTGLPNRAGLEMEAERAIDLHSNISLIAVKLSGLGQINDTYGYAAGDTLLIEIGTALSQLPMVRCCARTGNNTYGLLIVGYESREDLIKICGEISERVSSPFMWDGFNIAQTVKTLIGIAIYGADALSFDRLLSNASSAINQSVRSKEPWTFAHGSTVERAKATAKLLHEIDHAYEREEFCLYCQPIYRVNPDLPMSEWEIDGYELLTRWNHPTDGFLLPGKFIRAMADSGGMARHTLWVVEEANKVAARHPGKFFTINLPPNLPAWQTQEICQAIHPPLAIEITEDIIHDEPGTLGVLHAAQKRGVMIFLDDFGTAYSDMVRTLALKWDIIKIAKPLQDRPDLITTLVPFLTATGADVLLEGVEAPDSEALKLFIQAGGHQVQGFLLGRPAPL